MKIGKLLFTPFLLAVFACDTSESIAKDEKVKDEKVVDAKTVKMLVPHYFGGGSRTGDNEQGAYVSGDFNGDGKKDIAVLFKPGSDMKPHAQVKTGTPWQFSGATESGKYHTSLAIINGHPDGWMSPQTRVFALLDYTGVLETPSFQLILTKNTDEEYKDHQTILPVKTQADILILPPEAGIDTYIYRDKDNYKLFVPEEVP